MDGKLLTSTGDAMFKGQTCTSSEVKQEEEMVQLTAVLSFARLHTNAVNYISHDLDCSTLLWEMKFTKLVRPGWSNLRQAAYVLRKTGKWPHKTSFNSLLISQWKRDLDVAWWLKIPSSFHSCQLFQPIYFLLKNRKIPHTQQKEKRHKRGSALRIPI